jgi:bacteriorhodopsin
LINPGFWHTLEPMILAGILLLACAVLCVSRRPAGRLFSPMIRRILLVFQGVCGLLILLWTVFYLVFAFAVHGKLLMQHLGVLLFLALVCSYLVLCGLAYLLVFAVGIDLLRKYAVEEDPPARLAGILPPLALLGACIGIWNILFTALAGQLLTS